MKQIIIIPILMILLLAGVMANSLEVPQETLQAAAEEQINKGFICGNGICQDGEHLTCPQDCADEIKLDFRCIIENRDCPASVLLIYLVLALIGIEFYNQSKKKKK